MLLVITNKKEPHVDLVLKKLMEKGFYEYVRWNLEDFIPHHSFFLYISKFKFASHLTCDFRHLDLAKVKVVWFRRPGKVMYSFSNEYANEIFEQEIKYFLNGLYLILSDKIWLTSPWFNLSAGNKVYQLKLAKSVGLEIPETLITNSPKKAREFLASKEQVVIKSISPGIKSKGSTVFTSLVRQEEIEYVLDCVRFCPVLLQEFIEKEYDLRITIIGTNVFACAIDSQKEEISKIDWRRHPDPTSLKHIHWQLPSSIEDKLLAFMKLYHMHFAVFDMALTPKGNYVFFECNPNGQWLWIEKLTGLPITEAVADYIIASVSK